MGVPALGGRAQPGDRFDIVPRLTVATLVMQSEHELCVPVILLGGLQEPSDRFVVILRYAVAFLVEQSQSELCFQVALFRGPQQPGRASGEVLRYSNPEPELHRERILRSGVARFGLGAPVLERLGDRHLDRPAARGKR